jgi:hypothetical protein
MSMMYKIVADTLQSQGLLDAHPQDYLNFYCTCINVSLSAGVRVQDVPVGGAPGHGGGVLPAAGDGGVCARGERDGRGKLAEVRVATPHFFLSSGTDDAYAILCSV